MKKASSKKKGILQNQLNEETKKLHNQPLRFTHQINIEEEVKYDPKKLIQKRLEELVPIVARENIKDKIHPHFINFYKENKKFLTYFETPFSIKPNMMKCPYFDFNSLVGTINHSKILKKPTLMNQIKVDLYISESGIKYVLKTFWYIFDSITKTSISIQNVENFISSRYNEFALMKMYSACPYSTKPIDFNLIYIPKETQIVSELLVTYGGEPITKCIPISNSEIIHEIFLQNAKALNFLESFKIQHNDVKGDNILIDNVLGQLLIRYIDFDIGKNQSTTIKDSKEMVPSGYTAFYVAPELLKIANNQSNLSNSFSPWKCQVYSTGILILQLLGFFTKFMNISDLDKYKDSDTKYIEFISIINNFGSTLTDPLMINIIILLKICLSYHSDERLSANELLEMLENLNKKDLQSIKNQYESIIQKRLLKVNQLSNQPDYTSKQNKINEPEYKLNKLEYDKSELNNHNSLLFSELKNKNDLHNQVKKEKEDLESQFNQSKSISQNIQIELDKVQEIKTFKSTKNENAQTIENLNLKINELTNSNLKLERQLKSINEELNLKNIKIRDLELELKKLKELEQMDSKSKSKFEILKAKILQECKDLKIPSNLAELLKELFNKYKYTDLIQELKGFKTKFVENMIFKSNVYYTGPVNQLNLPHGVGSLFYEDYFIKFIGEFENGKIKYNLGFSISLDETYRFGLFENCFTQGPILKYFNFPRHKGKIYYLGESAFNMSEGNGKIFFKDGRYMEGIWEKNLLCTKQKKGNKDFYYIKERRKINGTDNYSLNIISFNNFEDFFVGENDDGIWKGKICYSNGDSLEGTWENQKIQGSWICKLANGITIKGDTTKNDFSESGTLIYKKMQGKYIKSDQKEFENEGDGIIVFPWGTIYEGEFKNEEICGNGKIIYTDGCYYVGEFKDSLREGKGKKVYINLNYYFDKAIYYEGNWKYGKENGYGKYLLKNGCEIQGILSEEGFGEGKIIDIKGRIYEGGFHHFRACGKGKLMYLNGGYYEGKFEHGRREGIGKKVYANGDYYEGEWIHNKRIGKGKIVKVDGTIYEGYWNNDYYEGKGKLVANIDASQKYKKVQQIDNFNGTGQIEFPDRIYIGEIKNGNCEGKGKMTYYKRGYYEGEWRENHKEGKGKFIDKFEKFYYNGDWKNDECIGFGKLIKNIGDFCYDPDLIDDEKIVDESVFDHNNNSYFEGQFDYDLGIKGKLVYINGDFYEGKVNLSLKRNGYGIFYKKKDNIIVEIQEGEFEHDKKQGKFKITIPNSKCYYADFKNGKLIKKFD